MASTLVYACDWCKEIVPKTEGGKPKFAAKITSTTTRAPIAETTSHDICATCLQAFRALTEGKWRRG